MATASYLYGGLLIAGGAMGAAKGSMASLYAGAGIGAAIIALQVLGQNSTNAQSIQALIAALTAAMMFKRYSDTGKFMPAGVVCIISTVYALMRANNLYKGKVA